MSPQRKAAIARLTTLLLLLLIVANVGQALYISSKAQLAQWLIHKAWQRGEHTPPWPWADTYPVAKLHFHAQNKHYYVLAGTDGTSLAFGPGWQRASAEFGKGTSLIAGHNDTHFRLLEHSQLGDVLTIDGPLGATWQYRITHREVVNSNTQPLWVRQEENALILVTCYPFNHTGHATPLRLVVKAEPLTPLRQ